MKIKTTYMNYYEYAKLYNANRKNEGLRLATGTIYGATVHATVINQMIKLFLKVAVKTIDDQKTIELIETACETPAWDLSLSKKQCNLDDQKATKLLEETKTNFGWSLNFDQIQQFNLTGDWFSNSPIHGFINNDELFITNNHYSMLKIIKLFNYYIATKN